MSRADRLVALIEERSLASLLVTNLVNVRYLTGFTGTNGACLVTPEELTIIRRRQGRGFAYVYPDGSRVRDRALVRRLDRLAIPPAYVEANYCADARAHLQATWRDAAAHSVAEAVASRL